MKPWVKILVGTAAFWAVWVGIAGLAMVIHGDCGIGATHSETAACIREKGLVGIAVLALGAVVYGVALWVIAKRERGG